MFTILIIINDKNINKKKFRLAEKSSAKKKIAEKAVAIFETGPN